MAGPVGTLRVLNEHGRYPGCPRQLSGGRGQPPGRRDRDEDRGPGGQDSGGGDGGGGGDGPDPGLGLVPGPDRLPDLAVFPVLWSHGRRGYADNVKDA
jgi:hypothetical protein